MTRERRVILVLSMVVVFLLITTPVFITSQNDRTQLAVTCVSAQANVDQLTALQEIADRLGIPHEFNVPEVPPECDGF